MTRLLRTPAILLTAVLTACSGPSLIVVGESVQPPEPPPPVFSVVVTDNRGAPLAGVDLLIDDRTAVTDLEGRVSMEWLGDPIELASQPPGFEPGASTVLELPSDGESFELRLRPVVLSGTVLSDRDAPLPGAFVVLGQHTILTDDRGRFRIERALPGLLSVTRPAWQPVEVEWTGEERQLEIALEPRNVRALHITGWTPQNPERWGELLALAETTEINAMVLDLKDESGRVYYETDVALAQEVGAVRPFYDLEETIAQMTDLDLYIIGRIVAFQDPVAARERTDLAVWNSRQNRPWQKGEQLFLDPTDPVAQQYALDLAEEACRRGVHEIQFDYIRFPDGSKAGAVFDAGTVFGNDEAVDERVAVIADVLGRARALLNPLGCAVAADIFAAVMRVQHDERIGQRPEEVSAVVDVLSPMIYPDHYADGSFGFDVPEDFPGEVVDLALTEGLPRLDPRAVMRPWIADYLYDASQVRAEIDSAASHGLGWMLWNANSNHTSGALDPD